GFPVHVADVERSVGAVREIDGAEPIVRRGEKFIRRVSATGGESDAIRFEHVAVHEVAGRFAGEGVATIFFGQSIAVIDRYAASRSEEARVKRSGRDVRA